ncbi:hypothetical protein HDU98_008696 [Podochytrium sp. JEL0797]|nr:hypothetical protein HDU98_008696 [Podochytrium sp. JEL0797]
MTRPLFFISHGTAIHTMDPEGPFLRNIASATARLLASDQPNPNVVIVSPHHPSNGGVLDVSSPQGAFDTIHDHPSGAALGSFTYPAAGNQALAAQIQKMLQSGNIPSKLVAKKCGLDHGAWIALSALFPNVESVAGLVQVSLPNTEETCAALGRVLMPLREMNTVLVFSGGLTHNQDAFRKGLMHAFPRFEGLEDWSAEWRKKRRDALGKNKAEAWSTEFDAWARGVVCNSKGGERLETVAKWRIGAPLPDKNHPEPSHFLPLVAAVAAAGVSSGHVIHQSFQFSLSMTSFAFSEEVL